MSKFTTVHAGPHISCRTIQRWLADEYTVRSAVLGRSGTVVGVKHRGVLLKPFTTANITTFETGDDVCAVREGNTIVIHNQEFAAFSDPVEPDTHTPSAAERIENAQQAASETYSSWEARCNGILTALGLDFGQTIPPVLDAEPEPFGYVWRHSAQERWNFSTDYTGSWDTRKVYEHPVNVVALEQRMQQQGEAIANALGLLDTPVERRRFADDAFYVEVVASLKAVSSKDTITEAHSLAERARSRPKQGA